MESFKRQDSRRLSLEGANFEATAADTTDEAIEKELRLACLEECLRVLSVDGRELVLEYYQDEKRERIDRRKALAERLGLRRDALANRAQRLRDKLEQCLAGCLRKKAAI